MSATRRRVVFAAFAVLILFSIVREWSVPAACARAVFSLAVSNGGR